MNESIKHDKKRKEDDVDVVEQTTLGRLIQSYVLYIPQSYTDMQYTNKHMILFDVVKNKRHLNIRKIPLRKGPDH